MDLPNGFRIRQATADEATLLRAIMLRCWTGTVAANSRAKRTTTLRASLRQAAR